MLWQLPLWCMLLWRLVPLLLWPLSILSLPWSHARMLHLG